VYAQDAKPAAEAPAAAAAARPLPPAAALPPRRRCRAAPPSRTGRSARTDAQQGRHRLDDGLHPAGDPDDHPGLALFYGGLVRSKNMLSMLMQVFMVFALIIVLWCIYGYSLAFTEGNAFFGGSTAFLNGIWDPAKARSRRHLQQGRGDSRVRVRGLPGDLRRHHLRPDRRRLRRARQVLRRAGLRGAVVHLRYLPIAHMVWFWTGPDAIKDAATLATETAKAGFLFQKGALDFAGGTVVHINAAVAGLVGAYMIGKRVGYGRESMAPHSLTMTMIGASLLWVGWFGFNAGSALEAATSLAWPSSTPCWQPLPRPCRGCSLSGSSKASHRCWAALRAPWRPGGHHPGVRLRRPDGRLIIGLLAGVICLWGVNGLKRLLGADDSLDVFGVHGVGGILGAILTGVFAAPSLGGQGVFDYVANKASADYSIASQVIVQDRRRHHHHLVGRGFGHRLQAGRHRHRPARTGRRRARRPGHHHPRRIGLPCLIINNAIAPKAPCGALFYCLPLK
jgi:Amt family ammonium transporter